MTMALRAFLCVLCPDCNSVCRLRCEKSWRVCLHLQSTQNMKVKLLSIIRALRSTSTVFLVSDVFDYCKHPLGELQSR